VVDHVIDERAGQQDARPDLAHDLRRVSRSRPIGRARDPWYSRAGAMPMMLSSVRRSPVSRIPRLLAGSLLV
jgi:hypothetical protein